MEAASALLYAVKPHLTIKGMAIGSPFKDLSNLIK